MKQSIFSFPKNLIYLITYILFVFFVFIPILYTFGTIFFADNSFFGNIKFLNKDIFILLAKSCLIASIIAVLSTFFGTILAFLIYKTNLVLKNFLKIALLFPLFLSPYILAVAWKDFFYLFFHNTNLISSNFGLVMILTFVFTPLSMLIIGSAFSNINSEIEEAALIFTKLPKVIVKITLSMLKPAFFTSFVLVFILSISEFSVPAFFGVKVFTTEIFTQFSAFYNHSLAILQSVLLITVCVLLLFADRKHLSDAPFLSVGGKGTKSKLYSFKNNSFWGLTFVLTWFLISVIFPFILLILQAFENGTEKFIQAFNLLKYTFSTSILLALLGAIITAVIGFIAAYFSERKKKKTFNWLLLFIFAIPSTIFGICLIKFYNHSFFELIYSSFAIIIIAYIGKYSFIASKLIENAIKQIPYSLEEAAIIQGTSTIKRFFKILIPIILPTLFAVIVINFLFFLGEMGITIMIYPPGTELMPIKVFTIMANAPQSLVSAMSLIVLSVTLIIIGLFFVIYKFIVLKKSKNI